MRRLKRKTWKLPLSMTGCCWHFTANKRVNAFPRRNLFKSTELSMNLLDPIGCDIHDSFDVLNRPTPRNSHTLAQHVTNHSSQMQDVSSSRASRWYQDVVQQQQEICHFHSQSMTQRYVCKRSVCRMETYWCFCLGSVRIWSASETDVQNIFFR